MKSTPHLHQQVEYALHDSEAMFRVLAEMTASAIFICQGSRFKYVNPATERLTGYSQQELLEMNFYDPFPGETKSEVRTWGMKLQQGETVPERGEYKIITKNGEERWIDLVAAATSLEGKPALIGTAFDVTEHKKADTLQKAVYRIAQAADRSQRLDDLFPAVHAIISDVMVARNFFIALRDKDSGLISFPYFIDEHDAQETFSGPGKGLTEYILRTGNSLLCTVEEHERLEKAGEVELIGTPSPIWVGVPLSINNETIGVMAVQDYDNPNAYGERELQVLEFVSSQVAMAINRKRVEDTLRENERRTLRRANELSALYETTRDLSTHRDITSLLKAIVDRAASLLESPAGSILLYKEESSELELAVVHGPQVDVGKRMKLGEGIYGEVAQSLKARVVDDYHASGFCTGDSDDLPVTAIVAAPMLYSGELVGVLSVYELEPNDGNPIRKYTEADVELLTFFASSAASAVHNARLFSETRQRLVELELLYQASLSASQIHSLRAVAQRIVDTLEHLLSWSGSIWLVEGRHPVLLASSMRGLTGKVLKETLERATSLITTTDDGVVGWVCKHGHSVRTGDVKNNPHYLEGDEKINSELCVPLKVGGKTIGCINVESEVPNAFDEHDERLLTTLANQAAIAIENARLFEDTRQRAARQTALNAIIMASSQAGGNLDEILNVTLEQVLRALGLDMGAIWLSWSPHGLRRVASRGIPPSVYSILANATDSDGLALARTFVVDEWQEIDHQFTDLFQSLGIHAAIVAPLLSSEKRIGGLAITSTNARAWTKEEIGLIEAVSQEVALAAERANLFEETTNRLNELEAVNRVSTSLRLAQSMEEMLPQLIDETIKALNADTGGVWLHDPEHDRLHQVVGRGWCLKMADQEPGHDDGMLGHVWTTGDIHFSADVAQEFSLSQSGQEAIPQAWSAVALPIRSKQETIGAFMVSAPQPREFTGEDARLLVTLTEMAGNAILRMRLNEQTLRHAAELETRVAERTAELQTALQKAQATDRLKSEFIANVNHELRTPLTNLILYYQMLRAQPTVKAEERLGVLGRELQRLRNLIEDLLNLSRLDLGQVSFILHEHDLNTLVHTLVNDRTALAEEHGLTLSSELQPDIQPVPCDEPTLTQAISNLLTNALNYTPSGGSILVRTMIAQRDGKAWVGIRVQDTGLGISPEDLPHLFERFYRGKTGRTSGAPGTGLGLAIVKQVVEHHHGQVEVEDGPDGRGTAFTLWLLVKQEETG